MKSILIAPRKYVQGKGVLGEAGDFIAALGKKPAVLWDANVKEIVGETLLGSLEKAGLEVVDVAFGGETTKEEADRVAGIVRENGADVIIGVGGGKTIDIAKPVAVQTGVKLVTVPTIAATDAPTSAATVWYDADGNFAGFVCWPFNPDLVLVDSQVVANGPAKAFASGMGDALSTWIEAEASYKTRGLTLAGGVPTQAALAIARLGFDTLMEHGVEALRAVNLNLVTPAVERIIETNVLHSGLGFESGGLTTAHMVANPLSNFPECSGLMHGEKVAFGIITQLCLDEDTDLDDLYTVVDFMIAIGLPVTFADLNLDGVERDRLRGIADACSGEGSLCHNHPFEITSDGVLHAMIAADALGQERKAIAGLL